jgi:CheY-like chemotaxis protein
MAQRVFVKVVGFTDVERHALNTVFRLYGQGETHYCLWMVDAPEAPQLALIDGQAYEAPLQLESPAQDGLKVIWVGESPPPDAWRVFHRPIAWPDVVQAMDDVFETPRPLDFDLDSRGSFADTVPPDVPPGKRALIASADRDERLYLRAKLALADLTRADEAETAAQALELTRANQYDVALVDFALPDMNAWVLLKELAGAKPAIPHVIVTKARASILERLRARLGGVEGVFDKPPHPGKLQDLLQRF